MEHLLFVWYGVAMLCGLGFLGLIYGDVAIRKAAGFQWFVAIYLVISCFLLLTTSVLYMQTNMPQSGMMNRVFVSTIPLFLCTLNILLPLHMAAANNISLRTSQTYFSVIQTFVGVFLSVLVWKSGSGTQLFILGISILSLIITLQLLPNLSQDKQIKLTKGRTKLSKIIALQSITLPVCEGLLFPDLIQNAGLTFSLPLVYIVNNILMWHYRNKVFYLPVHQIADLSLLSAKEQEIAFAVAQGLSNKQIAANLSLSPSTVKNHLYAIFKKLDITNRTALVAIVNNA